MGALLSERDQGLDVVAGRIGERPDCGYGGIGEQLYCRVPAGGRGLGGVSGEYHRVVCFARAECPPRQASEHSGLAGRKVRVSVVAACQVEQRPRPRQVAKPTSNRR